MEVSIKKEGWSGGGLRQVKVIAGTGEDPALKVSGKTLIVSIGPGLPNTMSNAINHTCFKTTFIIFISCIAGPSLRLEPDNETLQIARRVVTVVHSSKGINNNNHLPRNQAPARPPHVQGRNSGSTVGQLRPTRNAPPAPINPAPKVIFIKSLINQLNFKIMNFKKLKGYFFILHTKHKFKFFQK
jgi:hypothetical protein